MPQAALTQALAKREFRQKRRVAASTDDQPLRPIVPVSLAAGPTSPAVVPAPLAGQRPPRIEWVAPGALVVEEEYQRQLSRNSLTLIRRIVARWNWAHVKPPICARVDDGRLCVIDGQHTAIAAVTHGGIETLPVVVVEPGATERRAAAFIAHNRDRLHLTPMQMHYAALAAGDETARAVNAACLLAGAHICRVQPAEFKPGDTVAIAAIAAAVKTHGADAAAAALAILVDAGRAPVTATEIKALMSLLHDRARPCAAKPLAAVVRSESREVWARLAGSIADERKMQLWAALAHLWRAQLVGAARPAPKPAAPVAAAPVAAAPVSPLVTVDAQPAAIDGGGARTPRAVAPAAPPPRLPRVEAPPARLPRVEAEVLAALANGPADHMTLVRRTAYPGNAVATALAALCADGRIVRGGDRYRRLS